jgi:O-antigen/teichoic acid export membrane protein
VNEVKTLARQTVIYGLGTIIPRFMNYAILTPFYTRIFTNTRDYGIVTELYAWMVLLLVILTYGMETGFFRFAQKADNPQKVYSTALISVLATSIIFVILVNVFINPVASVMNYSNHQDYIRMFAGIVAIDAVAAIPFSKLRRDNRPLMFSVIKIINVIVSVSLVIFLLKIAPGIYSNSTGWFHKIYNPEYRVGYVFLANLISSSVTLLLLLPFIVNLKLVFDGKLWSRMLAYSFPLLLAGLSGSINDAIDKIILRRIIGEEEGLSTVGIYGAAYKIGVLMALFIQMFRFAAEPFFFERAKHENAKESYAFIMKYFVITMLLVFLGINLYISVFQYIIGANYREAIVVVPIISMAYLLYGIYINHSIWYKLNDLTVYAVYITAIGAAITIIINLLLVPVYGYMASAWAHIASYLSMLIMSFVFAEKHYKINYRIKEIIPYFILAILMVIFAQAVHYGNIVIELAVNTLFIIFFIAFAQMRDKLVTTLFKRENK